MGADAGSDGPGDEAGCMNVISASHNNQTMVCHIMRMCSWLQTQGAMGQVTKLVREVYERGHARGGGDAGFAKRMMEHRQRSEAETKRCKAEYQKKRRQELLAKRLGFPAKDSGEDKPAEDKEPGELHAWDARLASNPPVVIPGIVHLCK